MKILGLTPSNQKTVETPEEMHLRKLRDLGHEVIIADHADTVDEDVDVIVALSEVTCNNAFVLAKRYNKPFYAHMEWIPYWRIGVEPESKWGFDDFKFPFKTKMNFIRLYQRYSFYWSMANVKTLAAKTFNKSMIEFLGVDTPIHTKYLGVDKEKILQHVEDNPVVIKDYNSIACVARFVPHKRIHHIIEALTLIKFKGILNLVGYGEEKEHYEFFDTEFEIKYWDSKDRFKVMDTSKLTVALWSGMVPAESCYLGTPALTYDSPYMKELYGDTIEYAENNNIKQLAKKINDALKRKYDDDSDLCEKTVNAIEDGKINTLTQEKAVKLLESLIIEATKVHQK